jgi:predicted ATP-grasp superfamily ATP-dependent carboligase
VLDGHTNPALAFARSLGRAGHWVAVGHHVGAFSRAALSRYCKGDFEYPVPTSETQDFIAAVRKYVQKEEIDLVAPMSDWTVYPLSRGREQFEGVARLLVPPHEALEIASDKHQTILTARALNIPVPETLLVASLDDLGRLRSLDFPLVIKDRFSVRWLDDRVVFGSTDYAFSREDLSQIVTKRLNRAGDVLVQRFAGGVGVGFSCFAVGGSVHLPFQWERIREVDPRGSGSCARKSVALDPQILAYSRALVKALGFSGILMVEFKKDRSSGRFTLMEINPRPWGSMQLPIDCGIDYPLYLIRQCLEGEALPERVEYKKGITCRWLAGDLIHLLNVLARKPAGWPTPLPSFSASLIKILIPWYPGLRYDDLWLSDPRPGIAGVSRWFQDLFGRRNIDLNVPGGSLTVKGIVHCHTTYSFDGAVNLSELCAMLRREGFGFVALTEHARGISAADYERFVQACRDESSPSFIAIPGLELRFANGLEIAGIGISKLPTATEPNEASAQIRELGGFAIWVHPHGRGKWEGPLVDCDALEVLNGKVDGGVAPNRSLVRWVRRERAGGRKLLGIFGLDFHITEQPRGVWLECLVSRMSAPAIVESLREGRFVSRAAHGAMSSSGRIGIVDHFSFAILRAAFLIWRMTLAQVPAWARDALIAAARPVTRILKRAAK